MRYGWHVALGVSRIAFLLWNVIPILDLALYVNLGVIAKMVTKGITMESALLLKIAPMYLLEDKNKYLKNMAFETVF